MKVIYLKNFRKGPATNSSSTHSLIYRNDGELFEDLNIFNIDYYDRMDSTIAASREAKIKYVLANIEWNEPLVKIMSSFYPEMKEYYPLIREHMANFRDFDTYDRGLGMTCRGYLGFEGNLEATVDYLRNVIDDPDIIIVGGSDEGDFYYDTIEGHVKCPDSEMVYGYYPEKKLGVTKNGNYWVGFGNVYDRIVVHDEEFSDEYYTNPVKNSYMGRIRFMTERGKEPIPEFPELIDLNITDKCMNGCEFCFRGCTEQGKHADIGFLLNVLNDCGTPSKSGHNRVEFSIGGGDILLYPELPKLLEHIHDLGHIANITISAKDIVRLFKQKKIMKAIKDYVYGVGVSMTSVEDVSELKKLYDKVCGKFSGQKSLCLVAHVIPEYLGVEKTKEIMDAIGKNKMFVPILMLGYKENGRGADCTWKKFTDEELNSLFKDRYSVSIDTTFANRYFDWIDRNFSYRHTITLNEGEYSMYIDAVNEKAYKSSYQLDKPYNMRVDWSKRDTNPWYSVKEAFREIRKDGGFVVFNNDERHYWNTENPVVPDLPSNKDDWGVYKFNGLKKSLVDRLLELSEKWNDDVFLKVWPDRESHDRSDDTFDTWNLNLSIYYRQANKELTEEVENDSAILSYWSDSDLYQIDSDGIVSLKKEDTKAKTLLDKLINISNQFNEIVYVEGN